MTLQVKISKQTNFLFQSVIAIVHDLQPFYLVGIISNPAVIASTQALLFLFFITIVQ